MGKLVFSVLVAGGLSAALWLQYSSNERLRQENEGLRQALAELKPSQDVGETDSSGESLTQEQKDELLKLRAEVTQLREQTNQIGDLADANKKLLVSLRETKAPRASGGSSSDAQKKNPEDALPQDIHPRATWAYRGFGTPDATIESVLSAMINGDKAAFLAGFTPEMQVQLEKQFDEGAQKGKADGAAEFRILDRQTLSDDEMVLSLYVTSSEPDGTIQGHSEKTVFDRIDGQWKVTAKHPPDE